MAFGNQLCQERRKTTSIEIDIGERGISTEKKSFDIPRMSHAIAHHPENADHRRQRRSAKKRL
ncbi:MAG: hypothetical protein ACLQIQ_17925 [Beijerinckiaceae bacterium]